MFAFFDFFGWCKKNLVKCSLCTQKAALSLGYCGLDLCQACFSRLFEKRVFKANRDFKMVRRNDTVAVGISGGKDSAAMLCSLKKLALKIGEVELIPFAVDEGIYGYRKSSLEKAKALCESEGFSLEIVSFKKLFSKTLDEMMKARKKELETEEKRDLSFSACSVCGVFRKKALNQAAVSYGADSLAIGHNADDVAQTFLMNLMRKDVSRWSDFAPKTRGMRKRMHQDDETETKTPNMAEGGKRKKDGQLLVKRIKPLIYNLEKECAIYCVAQNLPFHLQECPYAKESFRGTVKDFLNSAEEKHAGIKFNLLQSYLELQKRLSADSSQQGQDELNVAEGYFAASKQKRVCACCGNPSPSGLCKACEYGEKLLI